ncbi:glycoside hydrolase family 3 protein, partial [Dyella silvatica]|uniref:glycoside hydrolase family 3 protein n=1 Tax=Dyella silvatica TaxID=2992128 RepID=UPI00224F93E0
MRKTMLVLALYALGMSTAATCGDVVPAADTAAVEQRVESLLGKLSVEQKVALLGGVDNFYTRDMPVIGLPRLAMSDGPIGVRAPGPSTAYAAGIGLAASWDPALAERVGTAMGRDARARGVQFLLGPGVNMYRAPQNGRNMEYYGEDPLLAGKMAAGLIRGVQGQGVVATVKHFAANNSEYDRRHLDSLIDERTLREIYLPAFEMAVKEGQVGAVMSSYNLINGDYLAENRRIAHDILKQEWGFNGLYMSDWEAAHDGVKAFKAGLDLEMPAPDAMRPTLIEDGLRDGSLSRVDLDDKTRRLLRTAVRFGLIDRPSRDYAIPLMDPAPAHAALDAARESLVLLKNASQALPLDASHMTSVAVIGPMAYPGAASAGGSSHIDAFRTQSILSGISDRVGDKVNVLYSRGLPSTADVFAKEVFVTMDGKAGLLRETFGNADFAGQPIERTVNTKVDQWKPELWTTPAAERQSIRWSGRFVPDRSGKFLFLAAAASKDSYTLYVDGKPVIQQPVFEGQAPHYVVLPMTVGKAVDIRLDYRPDVSYSRMSLGAIAVDAMIPEETRKMAAMADAAVVAVGFDGTSESEAFDRSFPLPWGQEALIEAVAALNKHTVVTVTSGGGYATDGWLEHVPALLQNWYPGQEGGQAIAEVLFGDRSPEGKLPISFERHWQDNPTHDFYDAHPAADGHPTVRYGEGVFLGYRWYTSHPREAQPLFAFGHGLSYTSFGFSKLVLSGAAANGEVTVSFDVRNTGSREGAEVAQVYVGDPSARVARPAKELKAFRKLRLAPGQTAHVSLT